MQAVYHTESFIKSLDSGDDGCDTTLFCYLWTQVPLVHSNKYSFLTYTPKRIHTFVVPCTETMLIFYDYVSKCPQILIHVWFTFEPFLNLNWTTSNPNRGFSSGFKETPWTEPRVQFRVQPNVVVNWTEPDFPITSLQGWLVNDIYSGIASMA